MFSTKLLTLKIPTHVLIPLRRLKLSRVSVKHLILCIFYILGTILLQFKAYIYIYVCIFNI